MSLLVINYHYVRPVFPAAGIHGETPAQFRDQLERLARIGTFVSGEEVRCGTLPDRSLLITFDDGLREQYEYAWPILQAMGIPALFFVNTSPIIDGTVLDVHQAHLLLTRWTPTVFAAAGSEARRKYPYDTPEVAGWKYRLHVRKDTDTIYAMRRRFAELFDEQAESRALYIDPAIARVYADAASLGTHGHGHGCPEQEFALSAAILSGWTDGHVYAASYPFGSRAACDPERVQEFDVAFTMERGVNATLDRKHWLGRISCADLPDDGPLDSLWELPSCAWC